MEDDIDDIEIDVNRLYDEMTVVEETIIDNTNDIAGYICSIFTVLNNSCGKVMFSQASVCPRGACVAKSGAWPGGTCMVKRGGMRGCVVKRKVCMANGVRMARGVYVAGVGGMRGRIVGHSSGQYAAYWNAFLYVTFSHSAKIGRFLTKDFKIKVIYFVVC